MSNGIKVIKRDGTEEPINLEKVHKMVEFACDGLAGVAASQVEMSSGLQFFDGIKTSEIQEILVKSASDLIELDHPNYQYVAARLLLFGLEKSVHGHPDTPPPLSQHIETCIKQGVYDPSIATKYSAEEWQEIDSYIDYDRDFYSLMQVYVKSLTST